MQWQKKKRFGYKAGQHIQSVILWADSTIAKGMQWSKDYAISDPLPLQWGRISVKHKEAAVPAFAAISPGTTYRTVAVESISVISSLSKSRGKVCFIVVPFFWLDQTLLREKAEASGLPRFLVYVRGMQCFASISHCFLVNEYLGIAMKGKNSARSFILDR